MKIVAIFMKDGTNYTLGLTPPDLEAVAGDNDVSIAAIDYHRAGAFYNKGFQIGRAGYSVKINNSDIRRLVPEVEVKAVHVDIESSKKDGERVIPDLPAAQADE